MARQHFDFPLPTTQQDIRYNLWELMVRIASNRIDTRRAGILLFALQTAARNLPPADPNPTPRRPG